MGDILLTPLPASRFQSVLLAPQITVIGNKMIVLKSFFLNVWSQIKQI